MAIIYSYPDATSVTSGNKIIGTQTDPTTEENKTVQFTIAQVATFANTSPGYTAYTALVTQAGTAAPTALVLTNTIGGTLTWARTSAGVYTITSGTALFTVDKTWMTIGLQNSGTTVPIVRTSDTQITVTTSANDDRITNVSFELRVYA